MPPGTTPGRRKQQRTHLSHHALRSTDPATTAAPKRKDVDTIEFLYSIIGTPLGYILWGIYEVICKNTGASIGVAILVFTFIVKLAMLPLSIKQQIGRASCRERV